MAMKVSKKEEVLTKEEVLAKLFEPGIPLEEQTLIVKKFVEDNIINDTRLRSDIRPFFDKFEKTTSSVEKGEAFVIFIDFFKDSMSMLYVLGVQDSLEAFKQKMNEIQRVNDAKEEEKIETAKESSEKP